MLVSLFRRLLAASFIVLAALAQSAPAPVPAPVRLGGATLFSIRTGLGPFTAQERATAAGQRLEELAKALTIPVADVVAAPSDTSTDILARDRVLLTVTDADAAAEGVSRAALAERRVAEIRAAIGRLRAAYSYRSLALGALFALLATAVLAALLWGIGRLFPAAQARLESRRDAIRPIRVQRAELISAARIALLLRQAAEAVRFVLVAVLLAVYLPLILSFFPWTREYAPVLWAYLTAPVGAAATAFLSYLPNLAVLLVGCAMAYGCIRLARFVFEHLATGAIAWSGFYPEWGMPTYRIVRFLILAFTATILFPYLPGSSSPAFRGMSIFLGVLVSLGSTSAVANVVAGTILTFTRAFQVGDRVRIAETVGDVVEKTLLATRVKTIKNELVTVPNAMVLGSHITNYSACPDGHALILHTTVTIGYDAPWRTVHELLRTAALRTSGIRSDPPPFVLQTALDDFYVHYQINAYSSEPARMAAMYGELHQNIQDCFNEAGVEIMSPHVSALRDGNRKAIPDQYLPKDYGAPFFRVSPDRGQAAAGD